MYDTEAIDLIEYYKWSISYDTGFIVFSTSIRTRPHEKLRDAISEAMNRQIEWATRPSQHINPRTGWLKLNYTLYKVNDYC